MNWDTWKRGFDAWENATAKYMEEWTKSPLVLGFAGTVLSMAMRSKAQADKAAALYWGAMGLPTKRDQERTLHALHRLESRLLDLEEKLEENVR
jgi:hypothetical protein